MSGQGGPVCHCQPRAKLVLSRSASTRLRRACPDACRPDTDTAAAASLAGEAIQNSVFRLPLENSMAGTRGKDPTRKDCMGGLAMNPPEDSRGRVQGGHRDVGRQGGERI